MDRPELGYLLSRLMREVMAREEPILDAAGLDDVLRNDVHQAAAPLPAPRIEDSRLLTLSTLNRGD